MFVWKQYHRSIAQKVYIYERPALGVNRRNNCLVSYASSPTFSIRLAAQSPHGLIPSLTADPRFSFPCRFQCRVSCLVLSSFLWKCLDIGAAYGTAKSGVGISSMGVMNPGLVMRNIIPVVMAGVLGIYGLIVAVILSGSSESMPFDYCDKPHPIKVHIYEYQVPGNSFGVCPL